MPKIKKRGNLKQLLIIVVILAAISTISFFWSSKTYAYWVSKVENPNPKTSNINTKIAGGWLTLPIINLDELDPSQYPDPIPKGSIVIHQGESYLCTKKVNLSAGNDYLPGIDPQTSINYRKLTNNFTWYNDYDWGEDGVVLYNGKTYSVKWYKGTDQLGNTVILGPGDPGFPSNYVQELAPVEKYKYWFAAKLYFKGDIVYHHETKKWHIATNESDEINQAHRPRIVNLPTVPWEIIKDHNATNRYNPGDVVHVTGTSSSGVAMHYFYKAVKSVPGRQGINVDNTEYWQLYYQIDD